ncbi:unnamed protein product, partial [Ectocarpus sp. 13 AM-2016]
MVVRLLRLTAAMERGGGGGKLEVLLCAREVLVRQILVMTPPLAACISDWRLRRGVEGASTTASFSLSK